MGYHVETTLNDIEAARYVGHAARVLDNLERMEFLGVAGPAAPITAAKLCLFRTQWQYWDYMERMGVPRDQSRGVFCVPDGNHESVIATFVEGQSAMEVFSTLQHEGFHQYAYCRYGRHFPIWLNEGLAQYYQDALMVGGSLRFGSLDARRLGRLQGAIRGDLLPPLGDLLALTTEKWNAVVATNPEIAGLLYAHAWGLVWYLLNAQDGRLRPVLANVLKELARPERKGRASRFNIPDATEKRWREYMVDHAEPDPLTTALERMTFLSYGVLALDTNGIRQPRSLDELRRRLRILGFEIRLPRPDSPDPIRFVADDDGLYCYPTEDGFDVDFELTPGESHRALVNLTADLATHQPTLSWFRSAKRVPVAQIDFAS